MASRNTVGGDTAPQLVVKLIGSKLIRYYTDEEPEKDKAANSNASHESINLEQNIESMLIKSPPDKDLATQTRPPTAAGGESSPWPVLKQVPNRCMTAPSRYHSLSNANHTNTPTLRSAPPVALRLHSGQQGVHRALVDKGTILQIEETNIDHIFTMVCEELKDWRKAALKNIETELQELDSSHNGTIDQFHLTQVFLRNEVPLKLPTLQLLLHTFSDSTCPEEVHYRELFSLIADAVLDEEQLETKSEVGNVLHRSEVVSVSGSSHSEHPAGLDLPSETEIWLQRFQRMEAAMWLCDAQNSGYVDKEKARRLIQNYNLIFNLNLSQLKINEAVRGSQSQSRLHLDSLLQILKEL